MFFSAKLFISLLLHYTAMCSVSYIEVGRCRWCDDEACRQKVVGKAPIEERPMFLLLEVLYANKIRPAHMVPQRATVPS